MRFAQITSQRSACSLAGVALALLAPAATAQNFVDINFAHNVQPTNGLYPNNSTLGPEYFSGLTFDFINVAYVDGLAVDARVAVTGISDGYDFVGWLPNYNTAPGGPEGDLGVYQRFNGDFNNATGGMSFNISFYAGGGEFTMTQTLSSFRFLIYDHDGESTQSESIRTYAADGFVGHQIYNGSGIAAYEQGDNWTFDARGENHPEDGVEGGFIVYYQNTSSVNFDWLSTTTGGAVGTYGIFAALDGDLSLTNGSTENFGTFVPIPEPGSSLLASMASALALLRRNRPYAGA